MEYDRSDSFLSAGFTVVKQYDPATYARMESAHWKVSRMEFFVQLESNNAFGATASVGNTDKTAQTQINADAITEWARRHGVHVAMFTADVLVHEFRHTRQPANVDDSAEIEIPAFGAGTAFANRLPRPDGPKLARLGARTLRDIERHGA